MMPARQTALRKMSSHSSLVDWKRQRGRQITLGAKIQASWTNLTAYLNPSTTGCDLGRVYRVRYPSSSSSHRKGASFMLLQYITKGTGACLMRLWRLVRVVREGAWRAMRARVSSLFIIIISCVDSICQFGRPYPPQLFSESYTEEISTLLGRPPCLPSYTGLNTTQTTTK